MSLVLLAAAAVQAAAPAAPAAADSMVGAVVVEGRVPVVGDLQKGVLNFTPQFFSTVRPSTAMDMVTWLPGFAFQDTRDLRGLGGAGGNVLIDGKPPTSKTDTLQMVLRRIPAEQVERVDIIVGGAPGIDMRGWPVVANVVLKQNPRPRVTITGMAYVNRHGLASWPLSVSASKKDGEKTLEGALEVGENLAIYTGFGDGPWVRRDAGGAVLFASDTYIKAGGPYIIGSAAHERPFAGGKLRLNGSLRGWNTAIEDVDRLTSGPGTYRFKDKQDYIQTELGLRYERNHAAKTTLETQALERLTNHKTHDTTVRPPLPSTFAETDDAHETVLRATVRHKPSDKLTLEGSLEGALNGVVTHSERTLDGVPQQVPSADVDVSERRGEAGTVVSWKPSVRFALETALKVETSTLTGEGDGRIERSFTYLKPRTVMTWSPDKSTQVRLRVEHEVGQVAFANFTAFSEFNSGQIRAGNPNLRPQRAYVAEAALERRFWTGGALTLTLRRQRLIDVVDVIPVDTATGVVPAIANIGKGRETDVILGLTVPFKRLGLNGATLKGQLTWARSRVDDPVTGLARQLSNQPRVVADLHFAYDLPRRKLNVGFDAFYRGRWAFYRPLGDELTAAWPHFNLFVEYRVSPAWNLRAEVQNLPGQKTRMRIDAYSGRKGLSPLLYRDDKNLGVGPLLFLRVRRTFQ